MKVKPLMNEHIFTHLLHSQLHQVKETEHYFSELIVLKLRKMVFQVSFK